MTITQFKMIQLLPIIVVTTIVIDVTSSFVLRHVPSRSSSNHFVSLHQRQRQRTISSIIPVGTTSFQNRLHYVLPPPNRKKSTLSLHSVSERKISTSDTATTSSDNNDNSTNLQTILNNLYALTHQGSDIRGIYQDGNDLLTVAHCILNQQQRAASKVPILTPFASYFLVIPFFNNKLIEKVIIIIQMKATKG